jgi:hypothetical protein
MLPRRLRCARALGGRLHASANGLECLSITELHSASLIASCSHAHLCKAHLTFQQRAVKQHLLRLLKRCLGG